MISTKSKNNQINAKLATMDFETDPFKHGREPRPFAFGFYDGENYIDYFGDDAVEQFIRVIDDYPEPLLIYAHNGGKFDFLFFIKYFDEQIRIINGRVVEGKIGIHTLRDSYAILPMPLSAYRKDDINYDKLERGVRESHKVEILAYQKTDCIALHELVSAFWMEFGDVLTIGSAAMRELKKFHKFDTGGATYDKFFRDYYFGGRSQCFETGIINDDIKIYDVNSMYPHVMRTMMHPVGIEHRYSRTVNDKTNFVMFEGQNFNALPTRTKTGLNFSEPAGKFRTTIHEFNAALNTGSIKVNKILHAVEFAKTQTFDSFVNHFYESRLRAKSEGDIFHDIFYKLILNSSYGKFAQNPDNFADYLLLQYGDVPPDTSFAPKFIHGEYTIWAKPVAEKRFMNIATAASITGAARSVLLAGICASVRPLYCDTDSIICRSMSGADMDSKKLGAWKLEATADTIAIAGKKLYCATLEGEIVKKASKGARLHGHAIFAIARGDTIEHFNDAPTLKLDGSAKFITRRIKQT